MGNGPLNVKIAEQIRVHKRSAESLDSYTREKPPWRITIRRVVAFAFDLAFLVAAGQVIAFFGSYKLIPLGEDAWWIGVAIAAAYFAIFDSSVCRGQTLGKHLTNIEVRKVNGARLNLPVALFRFLPFAVLGAGFFILRYSNPADPFTWMLGFFVLFNFVAIIIFGLFHRQRRSWHDLLTDSIVVQKNRQYNVEAISSKWPLLLFLPLIIVSAGATVTVALFFTKHPEGVSVARMWSRLENIGDIKNPRIEISFGRKAAVKTLRASVYLSNVDAVKYEHVSDIVASDIRDALINSKALPVDLRQIEITLRGGYDIGIARRMIYSRNIYPFYKDVGPSMRIKSTPGGSRRPVKIDRK